MMNRVVLVGRLTKDPDLRYTPNGKAVANFTLAVNRPYKNKSNEQETDFINVVQWNGAENTANYLKKGSLAGVDGRIQVRNFEGQDGKRVYMTEVVAESVQFLEPKSSGQSNNQNSNPPADKSNYDPFDNKGKLKGEPVDLDDDLDGLPF